MSSPTSNSCPLNTQNTFRSPIWQHFTVDNSKATCKECRATITIQFKNEKGISCRGILRHMNKQHPSIKVQKYKAKDSINCLFCSLSIDNANGMYRHFKSKNCKHAKFYDVNGWSHHFNDAVSGNSVSTENLMNFLTESKGNAAVYISRKGPNLLDWIYVGYTRGVERRFRQHGGGKRFSQFKKVEGAVLIRNINREKALFLEGLLTIANKRRKHLTNKTIEWKNVLDCIECSDDELVHAKVSFWHLAAVQLLCEKWPTLEWIKLKRHNKKRTVPKTVSQCASTLSTLSPTTRRVAVKRANGFYST